MFDSKKFTIEFAEIISTELISKQDLFKNETIVGLALDCHPWHPVMELCLLTNNEQDQKAVKDWGKWSLADWKYFQFSRTEAGDDWIAAEHLVKQMAEYYSSGNGEEAKIVIFKACAEALNSEFVKEAMQLYSLDKEFEFFIADPDDPDANNYCTKIK